MTNSPSAATRPLRLDAERNRAAILTAAAAVYAERGCDTSLEDVAKIAGVGVGTIYRRFPNKASLIEALLEGTMRDYAEQTEAFAERADTEPWQAFRDHVLALVTMQAKDRSFSEIVSDPSASTEAFRDYHRRALRASRALTAKAHAAGVLHPGFRHRDLLLLTYANNGVVAAGRPGDLAPSRRLAELVLAGAAQPPTAPAPTAPIPGAARPEQV